MRAFLPTAASRAVVVCERSLEAALHTYRVDLHNHTPLIASDYRGRPDTSAREIVEAAIAAGLDVFGATDHYSVGFIPELLHAAEELAADTGKHLLVIPGAEIKVRWAGDEAHLVALFPPDDYGPCFTLLLDKLGLANPPAPVEELARVCVECDPREVAHAVSEVGGVCHVGHVDRTFGEYRLLHSTQVHDIVACPDIAAVEMLDHECLVHLSASTPVACIRSSDSHSLEEIGRRWTPLEMPDLSFEGLRFALLAAREAS